MKGSILREGKEIAYQRRKFAQNFYEALWAEVSSSHSTLDNVLGKTGMEIPG